MEEDVNIALATLRRMVNRQNSAAHRLPAGIIIEVASHLGDGESLSVATHVCHPWRSALIPLPCCLWYCLKFKNKRRALLFLQRPKSTPVPVETVRNGRLAEPEASTSDYT